MAMGFKTPDWVKHAVFYQIFPDRFAVSDAIEKPHNLQAWDAKPTVHGFKGGDLLGIAEHLDYIVDLGVNAIYLNPVFQSASNHRYHTHDYYQVDPILGGNEAFDTFLKAAHQRNIKVIIDGVFNHASRGFFQFNHILETGAESPYLDWFRVKGFPLNAYQGEHQYDGWYGLAALPEFNTDNPQVRQFIFDIARYWLEKGIDGWRLDVPFCIEDDRFWQDFREVVKATNPEAYITGEIVTDASRWQQGDQFDGVMNYLLTYSLWTFLGGDKFDRQMAGNWLKNQPEYLVSNGIEFAERVAHLLKLYPDEAVAAQLNLLDSHDTPRLLSMLRGDKALFRLGLLFIMTYPGAPCVYYGDEIGISGGNDPDNRRAFLWDEAAWDVDQRDFFKRCIEIRKSHIALRTGKFDILHAEQDVVVYIRYTEDEKFVMAINRDENHWIGDVDLHQHLMDGKKLHDLLSSGEFPVEAGKISQLKLAPKSGVILK
jgi:glycosidase